MKTRIVWKFEGRKTEPKTRTSPFILEALKQGNGCVLHEVKMTGRNKKTIFKMDAWKLLHEFACRIAMRELTLCDIQYPLLQNALKAKTDFINGKTTNKILMDNAQEVMSLLTEVEKDETHELSGTCVPCIYFACHVDPLKSAYMTAMLAANGNEKEQRRFEIMLRNMVRKAKITKDTDKAGISFGDRKLNLSREIEK